MSKKWRPKAGEIFYGFDFDQDHIGGPRFRIYSYLTYEDFSKHEPVIYKTRKDCQLMCKALLKTWKKVTKNIHGRSYRSYDKSKSRRRSCLGN